MKPILETHGTYIMDSLENIIEHYKQNPEAQQRLIDCYFAPKEVQEIKCLSTTSSQK